MYKAIYNKQYPGAKDFKTEQIQVFVDGYVMDQYNETHAICIGTTIGSVFTAPLKDLIWKSWV